MLMSVYKEWLVRVIAPLKGMLKNMCFSLNSFTDSKFKASTFLRFSAQNERQSHCTSLFPIVISFQCSRAAVRQMIKYFLGKDFCLFLLTLEDSPCFLIVCHMLLSGGEELPLLQQHSWVFPTQVRLFCPLDAKGIVCAISNRRGSVFFQYYLSHCRFPVNSSCRQMYM